MYEVVIAWTTFKFERLGDALNFAGNALESYVPKGRNVEVEVEIKKIKEDKQ